MNKILIVGAGSVGTYLGTLLSASGNEVTLLGGEKIKKLHETILINDFPYNLPKRIYVMPQDEVFDYVFVTSKLYHLERNLKSIIKNKIKSHYLTIIQNGLVDDDLYKPYLKGMKFTSISVFEGYRLIENQLITSPSKIGWKTDTSEAGKKVSELLQSAGIRCFTDKDLDISKAEKTLFNCSVNLLSAIEKKTLYEIYNNPKTRITLNLLLDECYAVLSNIFKLRDREELRREFYEIFSPMRHYSSTYQDAISERKTEVDFLNSYIVKLGKKYNVSTPVNEELVKKFKAMYKR